MTNTRVAVSEADREAAAPFYGILPDDECEALDQAFAAHRLANQPAGEREFGDEPSEWAVEALREATAEYARYMGDPNDDGYDDPSDANRAAALVIERRAVSTLCQPAALTTQAADGGAIPAGERPGWDIDGICNDHGRWLCKTCALPGAPIPEGTPKPTTASGGAEREFVAGPVWREAEEEDEVWGAEVQTMGGYAVVATVYGPSERVARSRQSAILVALAQPDTEAEGLREAALAVIADAEEHGILDDPIAHTLAMRTGPIRRLRAALLKKGGGE